MAAARVIRGDDLNSSEIREFIDVARRLCDVIDQVADLPEIEFLKHMQQLVPLVYSKSFDIGRPWDYEDDVGDTAILESRPGVPMPYSSINEWWKVLRDAIGRKLGWHRIFHFVYDPAHPNDRKVIGADLADCVADIYIDLKTGLLHWDQGTDENKVEAIWQWKQGVRDWGTLAAEIMLPIHHLLHTHYDEDSDCWRPFYEVTP